MGILLARYMGILKLARYMGILKLARSRTPGSSFNLLSLWPETNADEVSQW